MSRDLDRARSDLATILADVEKWKASLATAEADLTAAENVDGLTPADLDGAGEAAVRAAGKAAAARRALTVARGRVLPARRAVLLAEAADEDAAGVAASKVSTAHARKARLLLAQLRDLDGVDYVPKPADDTPTWVRDTEPAGVPRGVLLERAAWAHRVRAGVLRHVVEHGRMPDALEWASLDVVTWLSDPAAQGVIPESVGEYLAAVAAPA